MRHLIEQLQLAGLSEREAKVYLASLSLGPAAIQDIADTAKIGRSTVYPVIEALVDMGLMTAVERDGRRVYASEPPDRMVQWVQSRADDLLFKMRTLENALPEFLALERRYEYLPHASVFEGRAGIQEIARRFEEVPGDFFEIVPYDAFKKFYDEKEFERHRELLVRSQTHGRILVVADKPPIDSMCYVHERYGWHARYLPPKDAPLSGHVSVKGSEIFCFTYDQMPIGVILENASLARTLRQVFELAWEAAPRDFAFPK